MKMKALVMVMLVIFASFASCSAAVLMLSQSNTSKCLPARPFALVDVENGTIIVTPMGPIDTPGGPT